MLNYCKDLAIEGFCLVLLNGRSNFRESGEGLVTIANGIAFISILLTVEIATRFTEKAARAVLYLHVTGKATKWTEYLGLGGHASIKIRIARDHAAFHSIASLF